MLFTGVTGTEVGTMGACVAGAQLCRGYREAMLLLLLLKLLSEDQVDQTRGIQLDVSEGLLVRR